MITPDNQVTTVKNFSFRKGDKLGKGATGAVYLGTDTLTSSRVAVKVIDMREINNEVTRYLLASEKNALSGLSHPNIVKCMDIIQENAHCYIVTEYCSEGTLADHIKKKGKLAEQEALALFKAIVDGAKCFHQKGVVHRDLKPTNILMKEGAPKITDFGYCQIKGSQKPKQFYNVGSPSYMAPEAYIKNYYSQKSDVWALGVILYEMLVGKTPPCGKQITDFYNTIRVSPGSIIPKGVSKQAEGILLQCFNFDFNRRAGLKALSESLSGGKVQSSPRNSYKANQYPAQQPNIQNSGKYSTIVMKPPSVINQNALINQQVAFKPGSVLTSQYSNGPITPTFSGEIFPQSRSQRSPLQKNRHKQRVISRTPQKKNHAYQNDALNTTDPNVNFKQMERGKIAQLHVQPHLLQGSNKLTIHKPNTIQNAIFVQPRQVQSFQSGIQFQGLPAKAIKKSIVLTEPIAISLPFQTISNTPRYIQTPPQQHFFYRH